MVVVVNQCLGPPDAENWTHSQRSLRKWKLCFCRICSTLTKALLLTWKGPHRQSTSKLVESKNREWRRLRKVIRVSGLNSFCVSELSSRCGILRHDYMLCIGNEVSNGQNPSFAVNSFRKRQAWQTLFEYCLLRRGKERGCE